MVKLLVTQCAVLDFTPSPTAFTAWGAQGLAPGGNGAQLAQCDLHAQLRVANRGRLVMACNGDEAAGCGLDGAIQGGAGDLADV